MDYYRALHSSIILNWNCMACTVVVNDHPSVGGWRSFRLWDSIFDEDGSYANIQQENENEDPTIDNLINYLNCPLFKEDVLEDQDGICCDMCLVWLHKTCLHFTDEEFEDLVHSFNP